jgi:hypothetical protein
MKNITMKRNSPMNREEYELRKELSERELLICCESVMHLARRLSRGRAQG